jgi:hypothetical protein
MTHGFVPVTGVALDFTHHQLEPQLSRERAGGAGGWQGRLHELASLAIVPAVRQAMGLVHQMGRHSAASQPGREPGLRLGSPPGRRQGLGEAPDAVTRCAPCCVELDQDAGLVDLLRVLEHLEGAQWSPVVGQE